MAGFFSEPLARFQTEAGDIDAALANSQHAVAIVASHSQPDSFRMAVALHAHGAALLAARRLDEALPDLARASKIVQARFPTTNEFRRTYQTDYDYDRWRARCRALPTRPRPEAQRSSVRGSGTAVEATSVNATECSSIPTSKVCSLS